MTIFHRFYTKVSFRYDNIYLLYETVDLKNDSVSTDVTQQLVGNMTIFHRFYTKVSFRYDNIPLLYIEI